MFLFLLTSLYLHIQYYIIGLCYGFILRAVVELSTHYELEHFLSHYFRMQ